MLPRLSCDQASAQPNVAHQVLIKRGKGAALMSTLGKQNDRCGGQCQNIQDNSTTAGGRPAAPQVNALEAELGIKLSPSFAMPCALGTERLQQRQNSGVLTVSTSADFAAKWLVHRIGRFSDAYPDIDLRISASLHHVDFAREDADVAQASRHLPPLAEADIQETNAVAVRVAS
jgi:hypothetical protein